MTIAAFLRFWSEKRVSSTSAVQLRREAEKARKLADNAVTERDRNKFIDIARSLDKEAAAIDSTLVGASPRSFFGRAVGAVREQVPSSAK